MRKAKVAKVKVKVIKKLKGMRQQVLVKKGKSFFVVSSAFAPFSGFETLVFPATKTGEITSWLEVAGGKLMSQAEAIKDLESRDLKPEDMEDSYAF